MSDQESILVADSAALEEACAALLEAEFLAVDTEFWRQKTYYPVLCLVQLASPTRCVVVDTLAPGLDLGPLRRLLLDPRSTKVLHAASQDLEVLLLALGRVPGPLFDTQLAARALGLGEQPGYATLVQQLLGVSVDKGAQVLDWTRRPLSPAQLRYAADDVRHLADLYPLLRERLEQAGRAAEFQRRMSGLEDPARYQVPPAEAWRKVKIRRPTAQAQAILVQVAAWREERARARNLPRGWILPDATLIALANRAPRRVEELAALPQMPPRLAQGPGGEELVACVKRGLDGAPLAPGPTGR